LVVHGILVVVLQLPSFGVGVGGVRLTLGVRVGIGVLVGVAGPGGVGGSGHPLSALFTARMTMATVASAPLGTPCEHAAG